MRDLIEARLWADHGHQLSGDLHRLFAGVSHTMKRLAAIQFEAPWRNGETEPALQGPPRLRLVGLALGAALTTVAATLALSGAAAPAGAMII